MRKLYFLQSKSDLNKKKKTNHLCNINSQNSLSSRKYYKEWKELVCCLQIGSTYAHHVACQRCFRVATTMFCPFAFFIFCLVLLLYSVRSNQVRIRKHSLIIAVISGLKNANNPEVSVSKL